MTSPTNPQPDEIERVPCLSCDGTGKRNIFEVARERVFGAADKMAAQMGATFKLNAIGKRRLEEEVASIRAALTNTTEGGES